MKQNAPNSVVIRTANAHAAKAAVPTNDALPASQLSQSPPQASGNNQIGAEENALRKLIDSKIAAYRSEDQSPFNSNLVKDKDLNLPDGVYDTTVDGRYFPTRKGTPRYLLRHTIANGDFAGVTLWQDLYLTENGTLFSLPFLLEFGLDSYEVIRNTVITGIRCETTIVTEELFSGQKKSVVVSFVVVGDQPPVNPVCPPADDDDGSDDVDDSDDFLI